MKKLLEAFLCISNHNREMLKLISPQLPRYSNGFSGQITATFLQSSCTRWKSADCHRFVLWPKLPFAFVHQTEHACLDRTWKKNWILRNIADLRQVWLFNFLASFVFEANLSSRQRQFLQDQLEKRWLASSAVSRQQDLFSTIDLKIWIANFFLIAKSHR